MYTKLLDILLKLIFDPRPSYISATDSTKYPSVPTYLYIDTKLELIELN